MCGEERPGVDGWLTMGERPTAGFSGPHWEGCLCGIDGALLWLLFTMSAGLGPRSGLREGEIRVCPEQDPGGISVQEIGPWCWH